MRSRQGGEPARHWCQGMRSFVTSETFEPAGRCIVFDDVAFGYDGERVLDGGKVAEQGSPADPFAREDGIFHRMAELRSANASWSL